MPCYGDTLCELCNKPLLDINHYNVPAPWIDNGKKRKQINKGELLEWLTEIYALYPDGTIKEITSEPNDPGQIGLWCLKNNNTERISFRDNDKAKNRIYPIHKYCYDFLNSETSNPYRLIDNYWTENALYEYYASEECDKCNDDTQNMLFYGQEYEDQFYKFDKVKYTWWIEKPTINNLKGYTFMKTTTTFLKHLDKHLDEYLTEYYSKNNLKT